MITKLKFICKKLNIELDKNLYKRVSQKNITPELIYMLKQLNTSYLPPVKYISLTNINILLDNLENILNTYHNINLSVVTSLFSLNELDKNTLANVKWYIEHEIHHTNNPFSEKIKTFITNAPQHSYTSQYLLNIIMEFRDSKHIFKNARTLLVADLINKIYGHCDLLTIESYLEFLNQHTVSYTEFLEIVNYIGLQNIKHLNQTFNNTINTSLLKYHAKFHPNYLTDTKLDEIMCKFAWQLNKASLLVLCTPQELKNTSASTIKTNLGLKCIDYFIGLHTLEDIKYFVKYVYKEIPLQSVYINSGTHRNYPLMLAFQVGYLCRKFGVSFKSELFKNIYALFQFISVETNLPITLCWDILNKMDYSTLFNYINKLKYLHSINTKIPLTLLNYSNDILNYEIKVKLDFAVSYAEDFIEY